MGLGEWVGWGVCVCMGWGWGESQVGRKESSLGRHVHRFGRHATIRCAPLLLVVC